MVDIAKLKLPSVSRECSKILEMLGKEEATAQKIAKVASLDPMLSTCLIRYANSPLYRRATDVASVSAAINVLGLRNVTAAVMMVTMRSLAKNPAPIDEKIWQHCIAISTLAKVVAAKACPGNAEEVELAGMLHDIGALVLATNFPAEYAELERESLMQQTPMDVLEQAKFGVSRSELSRLVAKEFRLPVRVAQLLEAYHEPGAAHANDKCLAAIALAHWIEQEQIPLQERLLETIPIAQESARLCLGFSQEVIVEISSQAQALLQERFAF